jgi:hypothetical protein
MGLGTWTSVFMVAPAFAAASRLAVATGAWPRSDRSTTSALVIAAPPAPQGLDVEASW